MMREQRVLIGPEDIQHIELTCLECKGGVRCLVHGGRDLPTACPHCGADWQTALAEREFIKALRRLYDNGAAGLRLYLHVQDTDG